MSDNINRREALKSIGTVGLVVGLPAAAVAATPTAKKDAPGFIVVHQDVGRLPPHKAQVFCEKVKEQFCNTEEWKEFKERFPNWNFILQPTREFDSYVEIYHEDEGQRQEVQNILVECLSEDAQIIEDTPELRKQVKDYVLLMLGAPVIKLEFTEDQLNFCYEHSLMAIREAFSRKKYFNLLDSARAQDTNFLCEGALAHATIMLARIRMQQGLPPGPDGKFLDPQALYEEGKERLASWREWLNPDKFNEDA